MGQRPTLVPPPEPAAEGRPVFRIGLTFEGDFAGQILIPADITASEMIGLLAYITGPVTAELNRIAMTMAGEAANKALLVPSRRLILPD